MTSTAMSRFRRRVRPILATSLVLAASAGGAGAVQAHSRGHVVSLGAGRSAIEQFASKVESLSGASTYSLSRCSHQGANVDCHVQWAYPSVGLSCGVKADAYYSGKTLKVRRASGIACTSSLT